MKCMDSAIFLAYGVAYLALLVWGIKLATRRGWARAAMLPVLVVAALAYDNLILGVGKSIGQGPLLAHLNAWRFGLTVLTPLLFVWAVDSLARADIRFFRGAWVKPITWIIAIVLIATTYLREIKGLSLKLRDEYGALSYTSAETAGVPLVPVIVSIVLLIAGVLLWKKKGWPWLFIGSALMTVASAVQIPVSSNAATNAFELILLISIVATTAFQDRKFAS